MDKAVGNARLIPAGTGRNLDAYACRMSLEAEDLVRMQRIICDPQTSGGLLVSLPADQVDGYIAALQARGVTGTRIGEVIEGEGQLRIR